MAILTKEARKGSHWYTADGQAMHEVRRKEPGPNGEETRPTNISDARLLGLYPSVTGILDIFDKPQLVTWKINQAIFASLRLPKQEQESDEYYAKRVRESSNEQVEQAADLGTTIHRSIDMVMEDGTLERCEPEVITHVSPVLDWFRTRPFQILAKEKIIVNLQEGFAGTFDLGASFMAPDGLEARIVIDWKTRKTKPGVEVKAYDFQSWQIAAYAKTEYPDYFTAGRVYGINLFISSTEPGRIEWVKYMPGQLINDFNCYRAAAMIWRAMKDYDPRQPLDMSPEVRQKAADLIPLKALFNEQPETIPQPPIVNPLPVQGWTPPVMAAPGPETPVQAAPVAIVAPTTVATPVSLPAATAGPEPEGKKKRVRRTKAQMAETAAGIGATAEPVNGTELKADVPPPVFSGPPVPGADGQIALSINNWETPYVRASCSFINFCGLVVAIHRPIKPKQRPPVLLPDEWCISCPVTGLTIMSHEKVKAKGKSRDEWLGVALDIAKLSGMTEADIAETYREGIKGKQPSPPLDQITLLVQ